MHKSYPTYIKEQLDLQCLLCLQQYDSHTKQPISVCSNNHFFCKQCVRSQKFKKDIKTCPMCRQIIFQRSVKPLQAYIYMQKIKSFMLHPETDHIHLVQKLQKTQSQLKIAKIERQTAIKNQRRLKQQTAQLQNLIRKLMIQIKSKQQIIVSLKLKSQQKQNFPNNYLKYTAISQKTINSSTNLTQLRPNLLHKFNTNNSEQKIKFVNNVNRQNQEQDEKILCKICKTKHSVLCFGIVCLKCYKKPKI